jgi:predicted flap endonuclease-1-like 5' DNA nuclease
MWYLINMYWLPLVLALALGMAVGWFTCGRQDTRWWQGWVPWGGGLFLAGLVVALLRWLPGRYGLWLDTALLLFAAYTIGCCLGCILRQWLAQPSAYELAAAGPAGSSFTNGEGTSAARDLAGPVAPRLAEMPRPAPVAAAAPVTEAAMPEPAAPAQPLSPVIDRPAGSAPMPPVEGQDLFPGRRPPGIGAPRHGDPDDLKRIRGIGPQNEGKLHGLGIWHFSQIADWQPEEALWVGSYLAFPGRIERESWIRQASILAGGGQTDFSQRVARGEVATSRDDGSRGQSNIADMGRDAIPGDRPNGLPSPRGGAGDDLMRLEGMTQEQVEHLNRLGIWHFDQVAALEPSERVFVSRILGLATARRLDAWVAQAKAIAQAPRE